MSEEKKQQETMQELSEKELSAAVGGIVLPIILDSERDDDLEKCIVEKFESVKAIGG